MKRDIINFFDLEKLMSGKDLFYNNQVINFSQVLEEKCVLFINYIKDNSKISIETDIEKEIYIQIDPYAIDRIINNLIDNAIRYSNKGKIEINLKSINDKIHFIVKDNGIGIPDDQKEQIFEPYFQLSTERNNYQGIGLGLSIVKKIVDSVKGEIILESKKNEGTCFTIIFEKHNAEEVESNPEIISRMPSINKMEKNEDRYIKGRHNILFVEDSIDLLNIMHNNLSNQYNIFLAENGKQALEKIENIPLPDIIISDIMMPEMSGYEFRETILENKKFKDIPFIFLTAKTLDEDKIKGLKMGAVDYINKPFPMDELIMKIDNFMSKKIKDEHEKKMIMDEAKEFVANKFEEIVNDKTNPDKNGSLPFKEKCKKFNITEKETEIIKLVMEGRQNKEIGTKLNCSEDVIKQKLSKIYSKTGLSNRIELINLFK